MTPEYIGASLDKAIIELANLVVKGLYPGRDNFRDDLISISTEEIACWGDWPNVDNMKAVLPFIHGEDQSIVGLNGLKEQSIELKVDLIRSLAGIVDDFQSCFPRA